MTHTSTTPAEVKRLREEARHKSYWSIDDKRLVNAAADALESFRRRIAETEAALSQLHSFVAIMFGHGPDAIIPVAIDTPLGVPVKIGAIMSQAKAALSASTSLQDDREGKVREEERERCAKIAEAGIEYEGTALPSIQRLEYSHAFTRNAIRRAVAAAIRQDR